LPAMGRARHVRGSRSEGGAPSTDTASRRRPPFGQALCGPDGPAYAGNGLNAARRTSRSARAHSHIGGATHQRRDDHRSERVHEAARVGPARGGSAAARRPIAGTTSTRRRGGAQRGQRVDDRSARFSGGQASTVDQRCAAGRTPRYGRRSMPSCVAVETGRGRPATATVPDWSREPFESAAAHSRRHSTGRRWRRSGVRAVPRRTAGVDADGKPSKPYRLSCDTHGPGWTWPEPSFRTPQGERSDTSSGPAPSRSRSADNRPPTQHHPVGRRTHRTMGTGQVMKRPPGGAHRAALPGRATGTINTTCGPAARALPARERGARPPEEGVTKFASDILIGRADSDARPPARPPRGLIGAMKMVLPTPRDGPG